MKKIKSKHKLSIEKKEKCLLVHVPKVDTFASNSRWTSIINFISMGIFSLCHQLESNGFNTEIIHLGLEKYLNQDFSISRYVKDYDIKFIGMSLHWHFQSYDTIEVARAIKKENPGTYIVLGGYTASCYAEEILAEYPFIDAIIQGEGEASIAKLAKKILYGEGEFENIPNLYWRENGEIKKYVKTFVATSEDLDNFSFYSELKRLKNHLSYLKLSLRMHYIRDNDNNFFENTTCNSIKTICLGRGCTGNCTWCGGGANALKKIINRDFISWRSPQKVAEEILMLKKEYDVNHFYICFDPTPSEQTRIIELFRILGQSGEKISIFFECFRLPTKDFMLEFKANLSENSIIAISPEFANEKLRDFHKSFSFTNDELENVLEIMGDLKLNAMLFFTDIPSLTKENSDETVDYVKYLREKFISVKNAFILPINDYEPGAPWTENPSKYGVNFETKTFKDFYLEHSEPIISWESSDFFEKNHKDSVSL